jgi:hypothetical protein
MISRLLFLGCIYAAMFLGWLGVGFFMLFAPGRCIDFVRDNIAVMTDRPPQRAVKLLVRGIGIFLVVFAIRFALRTAGLFR